MEVNISFSDLAVTLQPPHQTGDEERQGGGGGAPSPHLIPSSQGLLMTLVQIALIFHREADRQMPLLEWAFSQWTSLKLGK